jgi:hypothetical protein
MTSDNILDQQKLITNGKDSPHSYQNTNNLGIKYFYFFEIK